MRLKIIFIFSFLCFFIATAKGFTVVIDPGHGGTDPGAVGLHSKEKDLNLSVGMLLGKRIEERCRDVKVVYTRTVDKNVPLKDRPLIANKANGNFFISIHTNSSKSQNPQGTETYVIGLAKTDANFEVAKRENSVILLEKDQEYYQGFDPTSPESYIMFELMQNQYMDQSLQMADLIQRQFKKRTDRENRGVRQEIFWVLHQTKMPSVLIEMGFISNSDDEAYLRSKNGQEAIAESIFCAFEQYKNSYEKKNRKNTQTVISKTENEDKPIFQLQILTSRTPLPQKHEIYRQNAQINVFQEGTIYKYTIGNTSDYNEIKKLQKEVKSKYPDSFIVAFYNGRKISVQKALSLLK